MPPKLTSPHYNVFIPLITIFTRHYTKELGNPQMFLHTGRYSINARVQEEQFTQTNKPCLSTVPAITFATESYRTNTHANQFSF